MTHWLHETPAAVCPTCGEDCAPWRPAGLALDWRDDDECEAGYRAVALMGHRYEYHRVEVAVGDVVRYWCPWRGVILGSEVYRVEDIRPCDLHEYARGMGNRDLPPLLGTRYYLVNPTRPKSRCWPSAGEPARPIVFELLEAAHPAEMDLLDLLGWDAESTCSPP